MSLKPYQTLMKRGEAEFIVNKSRFIGTGSPAANEDEALSFLAEIRKRYKDASHNCYAYIIGANMGVMRYSDDGEPGGTAGLPIIEVMKARNITNCCVVVTRYFGGVLLGASGLVRAYSQTAADAINACGIGTIHPTARYMTDVPYPMLDKLEYFLKSAPVIVEDKAFSEHVTFTFIVRVSDETALIARIADLSEGVIMPVKFEESHMLWEDVGQ